MRHPCLCPSKGLIANRKLIMPNSNPNQTLNDRFCLAFSLYFCPHCPASAHEYGVCEYNVASPAVLHGFVVRCVAECTFFLGAFQLKLNGSAERPRASTRRFFPHLFAPTPPYTKPIQAPRTPHSPAEHPSPFTLS